MHLVWISFHLKTPIAFYNLLSNLKRGLIMEEVIRRVGQKHVAFENLMEVGLLEKKGPRDDRV